MKTKSFTALSTLFIPTNTFAQGFINTEDDPSNIAFSGETTSIQIVDMMLAFAGMLLIPLGGISILTGIILLFIRKHRKKSLWFILTPIVLIGLLLVSYALIKTLQTA